MEKEGALKIDLTQADIQDLAAKYTYEGDEALGALLQAAADRGHMTRADLIAVAKWKWKGGRTQQLVAVNSEEEVIEITGAAFRAKSERLRIGALLSLHGVKWPMASVILHFAFPDRYPILDVRAMTAVGGSTIYNLDRWLEYTNLCKRVAAIHKVSMRELDRALWVAGGDAGAS